MTFVNRSIFGAPDTINLTGGGAMGSATFSGVKASDVRVTSTVGFDKLPSSGGGVRYGVLARSSGWSGYRGTVTVQPSGATRVLLDRLDGTASAVTTLASGAGPTVAVGSEVTVALDSVDTSAGVSLTLAVMSGSSTETVTFTDSSAAAIKAQASAGLWTYLAGTSDAATLRVKSLDVTASSSVGAVSPTPAPTTPAPAPTTSPSPSASAAPTSAPVEVPDVPTPSTGTVGSAVVGTTAYAIPAGAVFVSPSGSDSSAGTQAAPLKTLARAQELAAKGATIVLRAGSYHENVKLNANKALTIQAYPKEAVWLDGSSVVSGWAKSGSVWVKSGWTAEFDASPTFTKGAPDGEAEGWVSVNKNYPMASHPDQVWLSGVALAQVGSLAQVTAGKFYVDYAADKLYVGSDPTGKEVRASDLAMALAVQTPNYTIRGIGIRRYAVPTFEMGAVRVDKPAVATTIENVVLEQNGSIGLSFDAINGSITNVTSRGNGRMGFHANNADGLVVTRVLATNNNVEKFNTSPFSGGFKMSRSRNVEFRQSIFSDNTGTGLWMDESVFNSSIVSNEISRNTGNGLVVELSSKSLVSNNVVIDNGATGLVVMNTDRVDLWNNSIGGSRIALMFQQDSRTYGPTATGRDPRYPNDPEMTWKIGNSTARNNVIIGQTGSDRWCAALCVYDGTKARTASQMGFTFNGNVFYRATTSTPSELVRWSVDSVGGNWRTYANLASYQAGTGQDKSSLEYTGAAAYPLTSSGVVTSTVAAKAAQVAQAVPAAVSARTPGLTSGSKVLGPQR